MLRKKNKITDIKKPKKRMRSVWVVLLTSLITTLFVGGGFAGYIYWQENFVKKDNPQSSNTEEERIEGKNVVVATGNNGNLFVSFYNIQNNKTITKKIATEVTVQGGRWEKDNKNEVVQFSEDGQNFITLEVKEPSLSDKTEFTRFVKYSKDGKEKELIIEDKNSLAYGNFIYSNNDFCVCGYSIIKEKNTKIWGIVLFTWFFIFSFLFILFYNLSKL
ncbi:hypothetical protein HGB13_03445, partial [bacterium]|nr:hypothetical protein [bacterium]